MTTMINTTRILLLWVVVLSVFFQKELVVVVAGADAPAGSAGDGTTDAAALIYNNNNNDNPYCIRCIDIDVYFYATTYDNGTIYDRTETHLLSTNAASSSALLIPLLEREMDQLNNDIFYNTPFQFRFGDSSKKIAGFISDTNITLDLCTARRQENFKSAFMDLLPTTTPTTTTASESDDNNTTNNNAWLDLLANTTTTTTTTASEDTTYDHMHKKKKSHLNIILGHSVSQETESSLGCADFPFYPQFGSAESPPPSIYVEYQVLLEGGRQIGGGIPVIAHEIGHWLGLFHPDSTNANVVDENPCDIRNINDFVKDTPTQQSFTSHEDVGTVLANTTITAGINEISIDSCPNIAGTDSIWNIMNKFCKYAKNSCPSNNDFTFTQGQIQRMYNFWLIWHEQNEKCNNDDEAEVVVEGEGQHQHEHQQHQHLFSIRLPNSHKQFDHQVIVYDELGTEVFNAYESFTFYQQGTNDVNIDLCLSGVISNNEPQTYVVVVLQNIYNPENFDYQKLVLPQFSIDGKVGANAFPNTPPYYLDGWLHSFLLQEEEEEEETSTSSSLSSSSTTSVYSIMPVMEMEDCPPGELLLEITHFNDWAWVAIYSPKADPMFLRDLDGGGGGGGGGGLYCIRPSSSTKPQPITVLIASLGEEQQKTGSPPPPSLEVKLNGETILRKEWPYYELFGSYRIFSALITSDMQTVALETFYSSATIGTTRTMIVVWGLVAALLLSQH